MQLQHNPEFEIRSILQADNTNMSEVIRSVLAEMGLTGPTTAYHDTDLDDMYGFYQRKGSCYLVLGDAAGNIVGGGGIAPYVKAPKGRECELRKMYFLPEARGVGEGRRMLRSLLMAARHLGYDRCVLETCSFMHAAISLYRSEGFESVTETNEHFEHTVCDARFSRNL